ncbi:50S ribosomal protein L16 [Candidatus Woesearchaeota archaeon]|nr:50S ribosomal protein L16 [Candidatus Woesearchaeota archaeon]
MATLRKGNCYKHVTRAYTRRSKYKAKGFIKAIPASKIVRFHMGDVKAEFSRKVMLVSKERMQIRHNALESARVLVNRHLQKNFGNNGYHFLVHLYPHHVLRENKMLTGAGADRMQKGMQKSFGRAVGVAAQTRIGTVVFTIFVNENNLESAKKSMEMARSRMPGTYSVVVG